MDLSKIKATDLPVRQPGSTDVEWVLEMLLTRRGSTAYKLAIYVFSNTEVSPNTALIDAATETDRTIAHRLRFLEALIAINRPLTKKEYGSVYSLLTHRSSRLRQKAEEVLTTLCPDGPPPWMPPEVMQEFERKARLAVAMYLR